LGLGLGLKRYHATVHYCGQARVRDRDRDRDRIRVGVRVGVGVRVKALPRHRALPRSGLG
jgi:hypothetical protein